MILPHLHVIYNMNEIMENIIYEMTKEINKSLKDFDNNFNNDNLADYSSKTDEDYRRSSDLIKILDTMRTTDWEQESKYHNYYRVNGKVNIGRTIKLKK